MASFCARHLLNIVIEIQSLFAPKDVYRKRNKQSKTKSFVFIIKEFLGVDGNMVCHLGGGFGVLSLVSNTLVFPSRYEKVTRSFS